MGDLLASQRKINLNIQTRSLEREAAKAAELAEKAKAAAEAEAAKAAELADGDKKPAKGKGS